MRTTLDIDDNLLRQAKKLAADEDKTLTRLIEEALREHVRASTRRTGGFRLQLLTKKGRLIPGTNLADRDALYERMEGRS
jgi:predicted transcriptional regulator